MTGTPESASALAGAPGTADAADDGSGDRIDVRLLGRQPAPAGWLLVTEADGAAGEAFTASVVPGPQPRAHGGDVLLRITPGTGAEADAPVSVAVWAVAAGTLVPVADWGLPGDRSWAERVRPAVAFAMSALGALEEHADLGAFDPVDLDPAAGAAAAGLPWPLPGRGLAVAAG